MKFKLSFLALSISTLLSGCDSNAVLFGAEEVNKESEPDKMSQPRTVNSAEKKEVVPITSVSLSGNEVVLPASVKSDVATKQEKFDLDLVSAIKNNDLLSIEKNIEFGNTTIPVNFNDKLINISILAYVLMEGQEDLAIKLVEKGLFTPSLLWNTVSTEETTYDDLVFAIRNNLNDYFQVALKHILSRDINKNINVMGLEKSNYLTLLAAFEHENTYDMTLSMLKLGADYNLIVDSKRKINVLKLAELKNNKSFIKAYNDFKDPTKLRTISNEGSNDASKYLSKLIEENKAREKNAYNPFINSPMSEEHIEMHASVMEKMASGALDSEINGPSNVDFVVNMVVMGFNDLAHYVIKEKNIDLNSSSSEGMSLLKATIVSNIKGGNTEFAKYLLDNGVNAVGDDETSGLSYVSLAAKEDSWKVMGLLIEAGANFAKRDANKMNSYDYAKQARAAGSLYLLNLYIERALEIMQLEKMK